MLFPGLARVVKGEAKKLRLAGCGGHDRNDGSFAAHDLIFKLLGRQIVEIRMTVAVVAEVEAAVHPLAQDRCPGIHAEVFYTLLDHKSRNRNVMTREGVEELAVCRSGSSRIRRAPGVNRHKRKIIYRQGYSMALRIGTPRNIHRHYSYGEKL